MEVSVEVNLLSQSTVNRVGVKSSAHAFRGAPSNFCDNLQSIHAEHDDVIINLNLA